MLRTVFMAVALSTAALLPGAAAAQHEFGGWSVDYDEEQDVCWMSQTFDVGGGITSSLDLDLPWDDAPLLIMRNSTWTMESSSTSAEVWFSDDWERTADATVVAQLHKVGDNTHVDVTLNDSLLERMGGTETIVVRVAGGPFERYTIGATRAAVDDLVDCFDSLY